MKRLSIGIQSLPEIIDNNYLYIDKTEHILKLIENGKYYFISRPRRFGKSLLISTINEIFSGNKRLFKNLYIYDQITWQKYPIINLTMNSLKNTKNINEMLNICNRLLLESAGLNNVEIQVENNPSLTFDNLIKTLSKIDRVVVLIDEYDKPIIDNIDNLEIAVENKEFLKDFYSVIKDNDTNIKFCLITGESKFSKVSIFSGLNNIKDISLDLRYATICGISKSELDNYFAERFTFLSKNINLEIETLKDKVKEWYNGYSWDGVNTVYNPYSILNFFDEGLFKNYWFSSGTPTFLVKKFKEINLNPEETNNFKVTDTFFDSFEIESFDYRALLFQTGYLTITNLDKENMVYTLDYPNKEVRESFLSHILTLYTKKEPGELRYTNLLLQEALNNNDISTFINLIKSIIGSIPYQLHIPKEAYYHSLFYIIMQLIGIKIIAEKSTSKGRIDGVLETNKYIYIIEFKFLEKDTNPEILLEKALKQIEEKQYFYPYLNSNKQINLLAISLNRDSINYKLSTI